MFYLQEIFKFFFYYSYLLIKCNIYVLIYNILLNKIIKMKINKLDLAKVISDFMFLWVDNPEEKAKVVFKVKHKLTSHWFEKYMQYYFENIRKYIVFFNWDTNQFDWWIDLKWIKIENWVEKYLIIQCKKYSIIDISEDKLRSFYWWIANKLDKYKELTDLYYITTSKFTYKAKRFADKVWIKTVDFYDIYRLQTEYSVEAFWNDIESKEWIREYDKCFNKDQLILDIWDNVYDNVEATDSEVFNLLKQVRRDYSYKNNQLRLSNIATNDTLKLLAKVRPHNLKALKDIILVLPEKEQNKILKYWDLFIERLKYIDDYQDFETNIDLDNKRKSFFSKILEFIK